MCHSPQVIMKPLKRPLTLMIRSNHGRFMVKSTKVAWLTTIALRWIKVKDFGSSSSPPDEDLFIPGLVIMGPGIESQGTIPAFIDVPEGSGALVVEGKRPEQASYEPFTPASQYELVNVDMNVTALGTYYVAVYEPSQGGRYGLALGYREEFGLVEWIRVPLDVIRIHQWEGQPLGFILAPMLGIVVIGYIFLLWQRKKGALVLQSSFGVIGSFVSFLYLGSSAIILTQMTRALSRAPWTSSVMVTIVFALLPLIAGLALLHIAMQAPSAIKTKARVKMAFLGIAGLFIWAGLVIGPVLAIGASLLPAFTKCKWNFLVSFLYPKLMTAQISF